MPNLRNHVRLMIIGMVTSGMKHKDIAQGLSQQARRQNDHEVDDHALPLPGMTSSSAHPI